MEIREYKDNAPKGPGGGRKIAWNGVSFTAPLDWTPVIIEKTYLLFQRNQHPIMEIKWFRGGKLSVKASLGQLTAGFSTVSSPPAKIQTPVEWEPYLGAFESHAFSWNDGTRQALGLVLRCKKCRATTLIQFFVHTATPPIDTGKQILNRFQDHADDHIWSLFDFEAQLPADCVLDSFLFQVGRFELNYASPDHKIALYRFAMAHEILKHKTLEQMAHEISADGPSALMFTDNGSDGCQWHSKKQGLCAKLTARLTRKPLETWGRLRHDRDNDKLLAVYTSGNTVDPVRCTDISTRFKII